MRKIAPFIGIFLLIVGCAVVPETPRESLVAAETTYQAALGTVRDLTLSGVIVKGSPAAVKISASITATQSALNIWRLFPDNADKMVVALASLRALQGILNTIKVGSSP